MTVRSLPAREVPRHVAIIMDGNGRWAKQRGMERIQGHQEGAKAVRNVIEACVEQGVRYLTLFSFSTENWGRGEAEVTGLMQLFRRYLDSELDTLLKNNIRLRAIGDIERLPFMVRSALRRNIEQTKKHSALDLVLAVSYGGREEILHATRNIAEKVQKGELSAAQISEEVFKQNLWSHEIPDPDLLIRTSGEVRVSNFLLWQLAYSEIVVVPELWPDFNRDTLKRCLAEYQTRERRYGLTSEQISDKDTEVVEEEERKAALLPNEKPRAIQRS